jgi:hypothetical protein
MCTPSSLSDAEWKKSAPGRAGGSDLTPSVVHTLAVLSSERPLSSAAAVSTYLPSGLHATERTGAR